MSKRLVRKLLQQTNELEASSSIHQPPEDDADVKRKKRRRAQKESEPVHEVDYVQMHIQNMLDMDRAIHKKRKNSQQSLSRLEETHRVQSKTRSKLVRKKSGAGVGNSRSSSSQKAKFKLEPTYDKKKAQAAKEKKTLEDIAKMLKKRSKATKKS
mmetsp:Transcript_18322/g.25835  ORF Transcript_18322/g.25835 Transcript_18322/m.25835 type:complete len:155 (+) Transcript_18322:136-600(+)